MTSLLPDETAERRDEERVGEPPGRQSKIWVRVLAWRNYGDRAMRCGETAMELGHGLGSSSVGEVVWQR